MTRMAPNETRLSKTSCFRFSSGLFHIVCAVQRVQIQVNWTLRRRRRALTSVSIDLSRNAAHLHAMGSEVTDMHLPRRMAPSVSKMDARMHACFSVRTCQENKHVTLCARNSWRAVHTWHNLEHPASKTGKSVRHNRDVQDSCQSWPQLFFTGLHCWPGPWRWDPLTDFHPTHPPPCLTPSFRPPTLPPSPPCLLPPTPLSHHATSNTPPDLISNCVAKWSQLGAILTLFKPISRPKALHRGQSGSIDRPLQTLLEDDAHAPRMFPLQ